MSKNLIWKVVLIVVVVALAGLTLYPPNKKLKPGMDLGGGTSLIYEINAQGLTSQEKHGLSQKMITVLRRRIDPANIQNLIWRPQGNTRFEIQMPLASAEARTKRAQYEKALNALLAENVNPAVIMRELSRPADERSEYFQTVARDSNDRAQILNNLAEAYDARQQLQKSRDELKSKFQTPENLIKLAGLDLEQIKTHLGEWMKLNDEQLKAKLVEFLGSENNLDLLTRYTKMYAEWAKVVDELTDTETGKNIEYKQARAALNRLNLSEDQIKIVLETDPSGSSKRSRAIDDLAGQFPEAAEKIKAAVAAYDEYYPFRGRLDDPGDIQRMLKGAGILEFLILPTMGHPDVDSDQAAVYVDTLRSKGPRYASDNKYVWCEVEKLDEWLGRGADGTVQSKMSDKEGRPAIVAPFGNKYYVLASSRRDECVLHGGKKEWKLERSSPGQDQYGRRAINFTLDERGGVLFANVTGKNIDRPLCIILDGIAISAPTINSRIYTRGQITGTFTATQIDDMVNKLNAGSLPARLIEQPISIKTIGPSLGADNRDRGIEAGFIGLVVVLLCMLGYYMLAGSIADMALLLNILFVLAVMAGLRATFTLPGIAGIILTIGMSVDANVLIFERIREEQQKGSSLGMAIRNGYQRALRTIVDANLTTFITAAILFWRASEEIKGFAIVLMLGILSSMFTAIFVTRVVFDWLLSKRIIKERLFMLTIIRHPNVNWMKLRPVFLGISLSLITAGLVVFFTRDNAKNNKYDIEFTGGTSVQISLKEPTTRQQVQDRFQKIGGELGNSALSAANIYSVGKSNREFEITTTETNKLVTRVSSVSTSSETAGSVTAAIKKAQRRLQTSLTNLIVTRDSNGTGFVVATSQPNKSVVKAVLGGAFPDAQISEPQVDEVVNEAIMKAFGDRLEIQQDLEPKIVSKEKITEAVIETYPELVEFVGGLKITCELGRAVSIEQLNARLSDLRFKPDVQNLNWYGYKIYDKNIAEPEPNKPLMTFVFVSTLPEAGFRELGEVEWSRFVDNETTRVLSATKLETSLPRVTQINPSVGAAAKTRALIAIVLSLFAIVAYIWVRFGNMRYGIAAIVALVHDVCITLGAVTVCTYIAGTAIGRGLLIGDFKIDLAIIAAFLTLIGYSLNDTIVVFDRIRENRKKAQLKAQTINDSINQTLSRTILTSFTTFIVVLIMYIFGGEALRGFTFAIGFGVIIGTYSSVAIAAPILLLGTKGKAGRK